MQVTDSWRCLLSILSLGMFLLCFTALRADDLVPCDRLPQLKVSAEREDSAAQYELARLYFSGQCLLKNYEKGAELLHRSVVHGYGKAQTLFAYMLDNQKKYRDAGSIAMLPAVSGDPNAESLLASLYFNGRGMPQNDAEAAHWSILAAHQGAYLGQLILAQLYWKGRGGLLKDNIEAEKWWIIAGRSKVNNSYADTAKKLTEKEMNPADIGKAEAMANEWKAE